MTSDFESWYRQAHPAIVTTLIVAGLPVHVADEATDEACVRAFVRWSRVSGMANPTGWVYRVARDEGRRMLRRREGPLEDRAAAWHPPIDKADLLHAIRQLPPRQLEAVALRYIADLPQKDVAKAMGVRPGTAAAALHAARAALRATLGEEYVR